MAKANPTADVRSVHTDALGTIGMLIPEASGRDAIHLAVEPSIAGEVLYPGQHIGYLTEGPQAGMASTKAVTKVGIVDPFLVGPVYPGNRFWLVVYPRTITSLRHVWEHPNFPPASPIKLVEVEVAPTPTTKEVSTAWMQKWANKHMSADYYGDEGTVGPEAAYNYAISAGHDLSVGPYESAAEQIDDEWWDHWENITGETGQRGEYFRCSC